MITSALPSVPTECPLPQAAPRTFKTPFLQLANIAKLPLISTGQQPIAQAQLAVGGNGGQNLEVAMMLDITGSMAGQKLTDLQTSATDLINILVWADQSQYTSKVSIVPFTEDIRLPTTTAINAARGTSLPTSKKVSGTTYYLSDCVVERTGTQKYTDAAPKTGQYVMGHYTTTSTRQRQQEEGRLRGAVASAAPDQRQDHPAQRH